MLARLAAMPRIAAHGISEEGVRLAALRRQTF